MPLQLKFTSNTEAELSGLNAEAIGAAKKESIASLQADIQALQNKLSFAPRSIAGLGESRSSSIDNTEETELASFQLPGNCLGLNGSLFIYSLWSFSPSEGNKFLRIKLGGLVISESSGFNSYTASISKLHTLTNRNSLINQVGHSAASWTGLGLEYGVVKSLSVDTSISQSISFSGQASNLGDKVNLEAASIWVVPSN